MAETPASAGDNGADAAPATPHTVIHPLNLSILSPVYTATYYLPKLLRDSVRILFLLVYNNLSPALFNSFHM